MRSLLQLVRRFVSVFEALDQNIEAAKEAFDGKTVMVLQSSGDAHYIQTENGTLGSMAAMIGF